MRYAAYFPEYSQYFGRPLKLLKSMYGMTKLRIVVRGDLQNKEMIGDTWSPTASMRNLEYFLADAEKDGARVHQLDFIGAFLQTKVKNRVFVILSIRYAAYFPEHSQSCCLK